METSHSRHQLYNRADGKDTYAFSRYHAIHTHHPLFFSKKLFYLHGQALQRCRYHGKVSISSCTRRPPPRSRQEGTWYWLSYWQFCIPEFFKVAQNTAKTPVLYYDRENSKRPRPAWHRVDRQRPKNIPRRDV